VYSALIRGIDRVRRIALWDGKNESSEDIDVHLVKHMVDLMRDTGGMVEQINPTKLSPTMIKDVLEAIDTNVSEQAEKKPNRRRKSHPKKIK